jgi:ABC-type branched-subunit amino acid transport system substrate-binding protein
VGTRRADRWGTIALNRESSVDFEGLIIADHHSTVARILPFLSRVDISTAHSDGASVQLWGLSGWRGDGLALVAERAKGAIFFDTFGGVEDGARAREVVSHFRGDLDREPTTPEVEIYDLVGMISAALEDAESHRDWRASVAASLRSGGSYEGATGTWVFDPSGSPERGLRPYLVIDDGQWVLDQETSR